VSLHGWDRHLGVRFKSEKSLVHFSLRLVHWVEHLLFNGHQAIDKIRRSRIRKTGGENLALWGCTTPLSFGHVLGFEYRYCLVFRYSLRFTLLESFAWNITFNCSAINCTSIWIKLVLQQIHIIVITLVWHLFYFFNLKRRNFGVFMFDCISRIFSGARLRRIIDTFWWKEFRYLLRAIDLSHIHLIPLDFATFSILHLTRCGMFRFRQVRVVCVLSFACKCSTSWGRFENMPIPLPIKKVFRHR